MAPKTPPKPPSREDGWGRSIGPKSPPRSIPYGAPEWWTKDGTASKESRDSGSRRLWETNPAPYNARKGSGILRDRRNQGLYQELFRMDREKTRRYFDELFKERPPLTRADSKAPERKERLPEPNKATPDEQRRRLESFGTGENMPKPDSAPDPGDVLRRRRNPIGDTRGTDRASRPSTRLKSPSGTTTRNVSDRKSREPEREPAPAPSRPRIRGSVRMPDAGSEWDLHFPSERRFEGMTGDKIVGPPRPKYVPHTRDFGMQLWTPYTGISREAFNFLQENPYAAGWLRANPDSWTRWGEDFPRDFPPEFLEKFEAYKESLSPSRDRRA